ncbi:MAG: aminotransferase class IV [Patescibacteria group bacterium]
MLLKKPGASYVLKYDREEKKLIIVPPWHPLNMEPAESPGKDYAQVIFEGMRAVGKNLILYKPKIERLQRSIETVGLELPVSVGELDFAIRTLVGVLGETVTTPAAYIRPVVSATWEQAYGVGGQSGIPADATVMAWNWPKYIEDREGGLHVAMFLDESRQHPVMAKEARNYAHGRRLRARADAIRKKQKIEIDEILCPGPYEVRGDVVPADGIGEDLMLITDKYVQVQPKDTFILGGTTRQYAISHLLPKLGLKVIEKAFTLSDLEKDGVSLSFAGNAVGITSIGKIFVFDAKDKLVRTVKMKINSTAQKITEQFAREIAGLVPPSGEQLLTPLNLVQGKKDRITLDRVYKEWA